MNFLFGSAQADTAFANQFIGAVCLFAGVLALPSIIRWTWRQLTVHCWRTTAAIVTWAILACLWEAMQ